MIEALNVFLAGDFENCVFVIAMEPDVVAAQIEVAYEKLFAAARGARRRRDLGWRFLEKMVQLPLSLPEPQAPQVERFLDSILAVKAEQAIAEIADDAPEVVEARELIKAAETTGTLEGVGDAYDEVRKSYPVQGVRAEAIVQKAARLEFADRFDDGTARDMLLRFARDLSGNPREIKRFVNVFRFYAYIDFWRRTQGLETPGLDGAGKLARLAIGWPSLLSTLAARRERQRHQRAAAAGARGDRGRRVGAGLLPRPGARPRPARQGPAARGHPRRAAHRRQRAELPLEPDAEDLDRGERQQPQDAPAARKAQLLRAERATLVAVDRPQPRRRLVAVPAWLHDCG